jgi:oligopeptide/dipeptide ABC transporter ATP-binding protein
MFENTPLLRVENLIKYYPIRTGIFSARKRTVKAVNGISFAINRGKTFGLVGESGCGKSTVGRAILNLVEPDGGLISLAGRDIYNSETGLKLHGMVMRQARRDMQIIFQDPYASLDPRMSIGHAVAEGIEKHRLARGKGALELAGEVLERCGIGRESFLRYPHEFSGGQRQRVGIARALALKPAFIVADEPIAALDVSVQAQILNLMSELQEDYDLTYLFISHDLGVVRYFCDRIGVMYLGRLVETGSREHLFGEPVHPYTQALLSAIPVEKPWEKRNRIKLKGELPSPANLPRGCVFHTRCPYADEICRTETPGEEQVREGHKVSCHHWQETGNFATGINI